MSYLESPPNLTGTPEQQLVQMRSYLYRLSEALSVALEQAGGSGEKETAETVSTGGTSSEVQDATSFPGYRDIIIKTAEIVTVARTEIDREIQELQSIYVAQSEFGTYQEEIRSTLSQTAAGIEANFNAIETITGELPMLRTSAGYIKAGFIAETDTQKLVGIAIGQTVQLDAESTYTDPETGVEYQQVNMQRTQNCAFYTADGIYFYVDGKQMAYFTNQRLHITDAEIENTLTFGNNKWLVNHAYGGYSIKWIGG